MTRQFKKLAHSLYECKYHVVFCPKYRYKIMQDEVAKYITQQIYRLSSQKDGVEVVEVNVQKDHVHLVVMVPPKLAISDLMGRVKGQTAMKIFNQYRELRKKPYWGNHFWSKGYCVDSIGLDAEMIRKYVRYQEKREKQQEQLRFD